jgi:hypothetical protein
MGCRHAATSCINGRLVKDWKILLGHNIIGSEYERFLALLILGQFAAVIHVIWNGQWQISASIVATGMSAGPSNSPGCLFGPFQAFARIWAFPG